MSTQKEKIVDKISYNQKGYIPVISQDYESGEVLMLGQMNATAVEKSFSTGYMHYCNEQGVVKKYGEKEGATQKLIVAFLDEEGKTLLCKVNPKGNTGKGSSFSSFNNQIKGEYKEIGGEMFGRLQRILEEYKQNPQDGAYTSFLFARGVDRIAKKVGEEAVEFVIASKNDDQTGVVNEAADLLYHTMVLLSARGVKISQVCNELCKRNR